MTADFAEQGGRVERHIHWTWGVDWTQKGCRDEHDMQIPVCLCAVEMEYMFSRLDKWDTVLRCTVEMGFYLGMGCKMGTD